MLVLGEMICFCCSVLRTFSSHENQTLKKLTRAVGLMCWKGLVLGRGWYINVEATAASLSGSIPKYAMFKIGFERYVDALYPTRWGRIFLGESPILAKISATDLGIKPNRLLAFWPKWEN